MIVSNLSETLYPSGILKSGIDSANTLRLHQAINSSATTAVAFLLEILMNPCRTVISTMTLVHKTYLVNQNLVVARMCAVLTSTPTIIATRRCIHNLAELNDRVARLVLLYESIFFLCGAEKNRLAFFRMSISSSLAATRFSNSSIRRLATFNASESSRHFLGGGAGIFMYLFSERRPSLNS